MNVLSIKNFSLVLVLIKTEMSNTTNTNIDGRQLYYMFLAGARKIIENQARLNRINVFPVNDGDTGTNMASTVRSVIENLQPHRSYKNMMEMIAETSLVNARGNSGIIFAQFLYGVSSETVASPQITLQQFVDSIKNSVEYVYQAVANPVEGTMLTIIRVWAEFIDHNKAHFEDFKELFLHSKKILEKALAETKSQLAVLEKANVVDAGAKAFCFFIEGMIDFVKLNNVRDLLKTKTSVEVFEKHEEHLPEEVEFRFCTEAIIKDLKLGKEELSKRLQEAGNSVVIAGAKKTSRIHVHTNSPAELFDDLKEFGTISYQKVDDMVRQSEVVYKRKWNIAVVTDSTCDLPDEIIDQYQIHMLPLNVYFGDNHFLDRVTIQPEQFYNRMEKDPIFPKTAQINEVSFRNLYSHLASHYDAIISIHLTDKFSGTYFSATKAAEQISREFNKPLAVIDSKNVSAGMGLTVLRVAQAVEEGQKFDQIVENAKKWVDEAKIFVSVKTLKYMVKGGRVSPLKGLIAKIMNVKPIVSMDENGKSLIFGKTYSQSSNMRKVLKHISEISADKKIWNYIVLHANNPDGAKWYTQQMQILTSQEPAAVVNISPVIGANAGTGAASVALMFE